MKKKIFEITGFFGWWGRLSTVNIKADTYREAVNGLKKKVMKIYKDRGKGHWQKKFYCKPIGYRVIQELKPYIEFKK